MIVSPGIKEELRWFNDARFGMFVHFGLYALLGRGEWAMYHEQIPRATYSRLIHDFNPHLFDADAWVQLALDAGARYLTVTAKHHDGFCLFDSALTDFKITNTPFRRDLIGELIQACQKRGLRIILYYSQPDWHHPKYVHKRGAFKDLADPPADDRPDWPAYQRYYIGQVEELCRNYGRIDGIWFDGSHKSVEAWQGREVYALIKRYQPHAVVNDRARYGDFFTPERTLPEDLTGYLFEACESVSPVAWGYQQDSPLYTTPHLVRSLVKMACAGGNYLLNVGPQPDGCIPARQARVLREIGGWMREHGQTIYQTEAVRIAVPHIRKKADDKPGQKNAVPSARPPTQELNHLKNKVGATRRGNSLYVHCQEWPVVDRLILTGIQSAVQKVRLLGASPDIRFQQQAWGVELIDLPATPPNPHVQVFELVCAEMPQMQEADPTAAAEPVVISLSQAGKNTLLPEQARLTGRGVKGARLAVELDAAHQLKVISGWSAPEQEAHWHLNCPAAGTWRITLNGACPVNTEEAVVQVSIAGQKWSVVMPVQSSLPEQAAAAYSGFPQVFAGCAALPAGPAVLTVRPERLAWDYVLGQVAGLELEPI